jgi:hypothetical protein
MCAFSFVALLSLISSVTDCINSQVGRTVTIVMIRSGEKRILDGDLTLFVEPDGSIYDGRCHKIENIPFTLDFRC